MDKKSNCFYCKIELNSNTECKLTLKKKDGTLGDTLIVCQKHYDILKPKENADG